MKRLRFHDFILECITVTAMISAVASPFVFDIWPHKGVALFLCAVVWLALFFFANRHLGCQDSNLLLEDDEE